MLELNGLQQHLGKDLRLRFFDGEVVQAKLLQVDTEEHDDIMYEVLGTAFVALIADLRSWDLIENGPESGTG